MWSARVESESAAYFWQVSCSRSCSTWRNVELFHFTRACSYRVCFFNTVITILLVEGRCLEIDVSSFFIHLSSEYRGCRPARVLSIRVQTQDDEPAPCPSVKAATALTYVFTTWTIHLFLTNYIESVDKNTGIANPPKVWEKNIVYNKNSLHVKYM